MNIAAIDTATASPSVAVLSGAVAIDRRLGRRDVFRDTLPALQALLDGHAIGWNDLDAVAVMAGPGSFTGLRIGATVAIGIAETNATALQAVPTLIVVAEARSPASVSRVWASMDARRGRRYAAHCERVDGVWSQRRGPLDLEPLGIEELAAGALEVRLESSGSSIALAAPLARIAARSPGAFVVPDPAALTLQYARAGVDAP